MFVVTFGMVWMFRINDGSFGEPFTVFIVHHLQSKFQLGFSNVK